MHAMLKNNKSYLLQAISFERCSLLFVKASLAMTG